MYTSSFLDTQPVGCQFEPFLHIDQRSEFASEPLLISEDRTAIMRQITGLDATPEHDLDRFSQRMSLLRELGDMVPVANFLPYMSSAGGVILSEVVDGEPFTSRVHALREGISQKDKAQLITPIQHTIGRLSSYFAQRIIATKPVVVDTLKSNQWVVGSTLADPKIRPRLVDHDAHVVVPTDEHYSEHEKLVIVDLVIAQAASLAVFLNNIGNLPEVKKPMLFAKATGGLLKMVQEVGVAGIEPRSVKDPVHKMGEIMRLALESRSVSNEPMFDISDIHDRIVKARLECADTERISAKM